jgi:hypothetical protein
MIADYLDRLGGALSFDRALAHRACVEIEDHLLETMAVDPSPDRQRAEERAMAACGDPRTLAAEFAVIALVKRTRTLGIGILMGIGCVLVAMKARAAWYSLMPYAISDDVRTVTVFVHSIDALAFWASLGLGLLGAAYLAGSRPPAPLPWMRRFNLLCMATTAALTVSVLSDGVLTSIRLATVAAAAPFVPLFSILFEISCAITLVAMIRDLARRVTSTAALQTNLR